MRQQHHGEHVHVQARPTQHDAPSTSRDCRAATETARHVTITAMNNKSATAKPRDSRTRTHRQLSILRPCAPSANHCHNRVYRVSWSLIHFVAYATTQPAALHAAAAEGTPATNAADVAKKSLFCTSVTVVPSSVTSARASHRGVTHITVQSRSHPQRCNSDVDARISTGAARQSSMKHAAHRASAPRRLLRTGGPTGTP